MISLESRKQETETAVKAIHEKASYFIHTRNRSLGDLAQKQKLFREKTTRQCNTHALQLDDDLSLRLGSIAAVMTKVDQEQTKAMEAAKHMPASRLKSRGQWIASLVSSSVLPGWSSRLEGGPSFGEQRTVMRKLTNPLDESNKKDGIAFTDNQLRRQFTAAESSNGRVLDREIILRAAGSRSDEATVNDDRSAGRPSQGASPFRRCLKAQTTTSERIRLANGSTANKVVLTNHFDAAKVLEEVEKARMLMHGHNITSSRNCGREDLTCMNWDGL